MTNLAERSRKIDLDKITPEDAERIGVELGKKAGELLNKTEQELNKLFRIYGQKVQIAIKIIDVKTSKVTEPLTFSTQEREN